METLQTNNRAGGAGLRPLPPSAADLIDSQEAADVMGKTYRQFTAYASYHKLPQVLEEGGGPPLYERAVIESHADRAAGRGGRGRARRFGLRVADEAEQAEFPLSSLPSASPAVPGDTETAKQAQKPGGMAAVLTSALAPLAGLPAALRELSETLRGMRQGKAPDAPLPPPQDRLLSAEDAAALLACHPRAVSRYVAPVLPRKWRESDILAYIAGLGSGGPGRDERIRRNGPLIARRDLEALQAGLAESEGAE